MRGEVVLHVELCGAGIQDGDVGCHFEVSSLSVCMCRVGTGVCAIGLNPGGGFRI